MNRPACRFAHPLRRVGFFSQQDAKSAAAHGSTLIEINRGGMTLPITRGMMSSTTDMWGTPQAFFERMDEEYHFQTDVWAIKENA